VALSLSDSFCVNRNRSDLYGLAQEHVDILIGNADEAVVFTETNTAEEAARHLGEFCDIAVVTDGEKGSLIWAHDTLHRFDARPIKAIDTTGAGDAYAAGILYGLSQGWNYSDIGRLAAAAASNVVGRLGPRIAKDDCVEELSFSRSETR